MSAVGGAFAEAFSAGAGAFRNLGGEIAHGIGRLFGVIGEAAAPNVAKAKPRSLGAAATGGSDSDIAAHAAEHWPKLSQEQLVAKIQQVRETGTTIVAPNGNKLTYLRDGTVLIEDFTSFEGGTIFKADNIKRFIPRWLADNP